MSKILTANIRVEIKDIKIDDYYFSFKYRVFLDNRVHMDWEEHEDDHTWGSDKPGFKSILMTGRAIEIVLEQIQIDKS